MEHQRPDRAGYPDVSVAKRVSFICKNVKRCTGGYDFEFFENSFDMSYAIVVENGE